MSRRTDPVTADDVRALERRFDTLNGRVRDLEALSSALKARVEAHLRDQHGADGAGAVIAKPAPPAGSRRKAAPVRYALIPEPADENGVTEPSTYCLVEVSQADAARESLSEDLRAPRLVLPPEVAHHLRIQLDDAARADTRDQIADVLRAVLAESSSWAEQHPVGSPRANAGEEIRDLIRVGLGSITVLR